MSLLVILEEAATLEICFVKEASNCAQEATLCKHLPHSSRSSQDLAGILPRSLLHLTVCIPQDQREISLGS